jgi:accessory colonization factor AcfC
MIAYVPLWILMMAMIWEEIKLNKKNEKEFEQFRKNCRAYEQALNKKVIAERELAVAYAIDQALKEKNGI